MGVLFKTTDVNINMEPDDFQELKNRIYSFYGYPHVQIELKDESLKYIVKRAVMYLNTYAPKLDMITKSVYPQIGEYTVSEYEQVNGVLDVFVSVEYLIGLGLPIQAVLGVPMSLASSRNLDHLTSFISMYAAYDLSKRMWGTHPRAELIPPNSIRISPIPYMPTLFKFAITVDHDSNLSSLNEFEINWLVRFCQASVGKVLGQVRRKYDGVTLPVGTLSTTGGSLYSENDAIEKELIEELKNRRKFPESFITVG